jgi:hypothetical protein
VKAQEVIAEETGRAMEALLKQAKRVPADKLTWRPMDEGRSVISQVAECAVIPGYMAGILETMKGPEFSEDSMKAYTQQVESLETLEDAEALLRKNTASAIEAMLKVPDENLAAEIPFFGPTPWKIHAIMNSHAWNMHYHTGQICYIQTLLGDKGM